jgi:hypothetical protein
MKQEIGPCDRVKSWFDAVPSAVIVPLTILSLGNRLRSIAATSSDKSPEAQRMTSASGRCFSIKAKTPGVWAMSPMLTTCHEDRSRILGACGWAALAIEVQAEAASVVCKKCRRLSIVPVISFKAWEDFIRVRL